MVVNPQEFCQKLSDIMQAQKKIEELEKQRQVELEQLVIDYKINESNQKRSDIMSKYALLKKSFEDEIKKSQDDLKLMS